MIAEIMIKKKNIKNIIKQHFLGKIQVIIQKGPKLKNIMMQIYLHG